MNRKKSIDEFLPGRTTQNSEERYRYRSLNFETEEQEEQREQKKQPLDKIATILYTITDITKRYLR
jgi:hypothetical protein